MYCIITFQCRECGIVIKVLIKDNRSLVFNVLGNNYSEREGLTKSGYFKCLDCGVIDNTRKFENVFN